MKTKLIFCFLFLTTITEAQTDFVPGYYLLNTGAKYFDGLTEVCESYELVTNEDGDPVSYSYRNLYYKNDTLGNAAIWLNQPRIGQVVFAYMVFKNRIYCFTPNGRHIVFSGIGDLTKAADKGAVGWMGLESEELMDGPTLCCGYYWITSQNTESGTVVVQLPQNKTVEIKQDLIVFYNKWVSRSVEEAFNEDVKSVEED
jgi:hypothetical protein